MIKPFLRAVVYDKLEPTEAHNADHAAKRARSQCDTMLPGSPGYADLQQLAMAHDCNTNKESLFIQQVLNLGYALDVPVKEIFLQSKSKKYHCLEIRAVAKKILGYFPEQLLAGFSMSEFAQYVGTLEQFWDAFRRYNPSHPVYVDHAGHLASCIPVKFHSDEGTGLRRTGVYQFSWGPVLRSDRSSWNRYYFWSCMNHEDYKRAHDGYLKGNAVLDDLCDHMAKEAVELYWHGVDGGQLGKLYLIFVSREGDLPALARAHHCKRNFSCPPHEMCFWCLANDTDVPFTDFSRGAEWRSTVDSSRPWVYHGPFHQVPGAEHEMFLAKDLFHLCHLGAVRSFCVNLLCYLVSQNVFVPWNWNSELFNLQNGNL